MKRKIVLFAIIASLLVLVWAQWGMAADQPKRGGILKTAINYDPPNWDPQTTFSYQIHHMSSFVYSKLLRANMSDKIDRYKMEIEGDLAEKWKVVSPTEYVFTLRKGVKFHNKPPVNGRELTSEDVKYSFERVINLNSPTKLYFELIKSIETPDRYTVRIILNKPFAPFLKYLAQNFAAIVPREAVEKFGDLKKWDSAIGSGPFILDSYQPNVKILFKRNPEYYDKNRPYLDGVEFRIIKSFEVMQAALKNKELDLGIQCFPDYKAVEAMLKVHPQMKFEEFYGNYFPFIALASDKPPFNDKRVRQALSMSIDRQKINDVLGDGKGLIQGAVPLAYEGSIPIKQLGKAARLWEYNPTEARRLIKEAGLTPPVKIQLAYTPVYGGNWVSFIEVMAAQMKAAGTFEVSLVPHEYGAYVASTVYGKYTENGVVPMLTPTDDLDDALWSNYHSTSAKLAHRVKDKTIDQLLEAQRSEMNQKKRMSILKELQLYLADAMYLIPTRDGAAYNAWFPYVKGYKLHMVPYYNLGDTFRLVWLDK